MSVVVVGKNGFIAGHLQKTKGCEDWIFLSHSEALQNSDWLEGLETLINCAFSSKLYKEPYQAEDDIDTKLAQRIKDVPHARYIMISSRLVYGESEHLKESDSPSPITFYGQNKLQIEKNLAQILGEKRLCILRCSNVFGFEFGRASFFGHALTSLKERGKIVFDISPETQKDFLPIVTLCNIVLRVEAAKISGTYNVGSGTSLPCGDVAEWIIEGYGQGTLDITDPEVRGQFFMDISKINSLLSLTPIPADLIKDKCVALGQQLKDA